jgi:acetyl esterase/lipase
MTAEMLNGLRTKIGGKDDRKMLASAALALPLLVLQPISSVFGDDPAVCKQASPLNYVRKGLPPFLLLYAERDLPGIPESAQEFGKALEDAGNRVEIQRIDGCNHNRILFTLALADDPTAAALLKFLATHAAPPSREKTP